MTAPDHVPPPLDVLLARRAWVRRFARTLARDESAADDLAQDAWLAAVSRPPATADRPVGWLRRVLTRRSMDVTRAARRRESHESRAPSAAAPTGDVGDVVAAAEMHRRVVEEVVRLDEPYRTTVLLRFFEDLPAAEVAARMGVPVETVRTRVRRAVERLRERLDERHGGRRAWIAPLLVRGRNEVAGPAPAGVSGMRVPFRVVIATAAVAVVAVAIPLVLRVDQVPEPSVVAAADEPPPARPPAPVHRRAAPQPAEPAAPAEPTDRAFVVRVTDADGAPAPGVRVRLDAAQNDDFVESATDAEGRASFRVAGPVRSADVLPRGADGRAWRVREAAPPAPESDGCLRVVEPADWVSGVVRGDAAEPLPGHEVVAVRGGRVVARALADADGRFELAVPRGATVDVTVTGLSRAWWDDTWRNTPTARVRSGIERWRQLDGDVAGVVAPRDGVDVVCHRPTSDETSTLRVRVVAPDGTPVAGVPIHVDRGVVLTGDEPSAAESGADGIAELREIPRRRVTILVTPAPRAPRPWEALGLAAPGERPYVRGDSGEVTLALVRGVAVAGRVEIPESFVSRGAGAAPGTFGPFGALVSVATRSGSALGSGRTDEHGAFRFLVPDAGGDPVRITASAAGADGVAWRAAIDGSCGEGLLLRLARDVPESDVASHLRAAGPAAPK